MKRFAAFVTAQKNGPVKREEFDAESLLKASEKLLEIHPDANGLVIFEI